MKGRIAQVLVGLLVLAAATSRAEEELPEPAAPSMPSDPFELFAARRSWDPILDAIPPCLPEVLPEALSPVMPFVLADDESASRRVLDLAQEAEREEGRVTPQLHLWIAVLRAQTADTAKRRSDAVRALDRALAWGGEGRARTCAYLERGRAELGNGLAPEASASALLTLRSLSDETPVVVDPEPDSPADASSFGPERPPVREASAPTSAAVLEQSAIFLRAEALRLASRREAAEPLLRSSVESESRRIRAAAALRLADRAAAGQEPHQAWKLLRERIDEAVGAGLTLSGFERRIAEHALRAGDTRRALLWITKAADLRGDERTTGLATIRKAEILAVRGRSEDAATTLQRLAEVHPDEDVRLLARLRIVGLGLGDATEPDRRADLEAATRSSEPGLAVHARALLLHRAVAAGEVDEALSHYVRLAYTDPELRIAPTWRDDLDAALELAVDPYCPTTLRRLAGRRDLFLREARVSEPFIALADCLLALDMPQPALDTYRSLTRSFGTELAARLTLRLARASLGVGDLASVRATLRATNAAGEAEALPAGGLAGDSWALFEAELALREGRKEAAADLLLPVVLEPDAPLRAVRWLAELARDEAAPASAGQILQEVMARWQLDGSDVEEAEGRAYVALIVADLLREQGALESAHYAYGLAAEGLGEGAPRERARFLRAALSPEPEESRRDFEAAAQEESLWGRLAALELRSRDLRAQVALEEIAPPEPEFIPGELP